MSFLISKMAGVLLLPSNSSRSSGLWNLSAFWLADAGLAPRCWLRTLEERLPPPPIEGPVSGIIMLGGAVNTHITTGRGRPP